MLLLWIKWRILRGVNWSIFDESFKLPVCTITFHLWKMHLSCLVMVILLEKYGYLTCLPWVKTLTCLFPPAMWPIPLHVPVFSELNLCPKVDFGMPVFSKIASRVHFFWPFSRVSFSLLNSNAFSYIQASYCWFLQCLWLWASTLWVFLHPFFENFTLGGILVRKQEKSCLKLRFSCLGRSTFVSLALSHLHLGLATHICSTLEW